MWCNSLIGLALLALVPHSAWAAETPDIVGFKLGMSMSDLKAHVSTKFKIQDLNPSDPTQSASVASTANEFFVFATFKDKAFWIQHYISFEAGSQPNFATLKEQLVQKYGPTSDKTGNFSFPSLIWVYNRAGGRVFYNGANKAQAMNECRDTVVGAQRILNGPNIQGIEAGLPGSINPSCPMVISADPTFDVANPQLSGTLTVTAFDETPLIQRQNDLNKMEEQKKHDAAEKAKGMQSPL